MSKCLLCKSLLDVTTRSSKNVLTLLVGGFLGLGKKRNFFHRGDKTSTTNKLDQFSNSSELLVLI